MVKRDSQEVFEMGRTSGYNHAYNEWKEKIDIIKKEILNYEDFDAMDRQAIKVALGIIDKHISGKESE